MGLKSIMESILSRRGFLKGAAASVVSASALAGCSKDDGGDAYYLSGTQENLPRPVIDETVYMGAAGHNCGGRCLIGFHVKNGVIKRITTDERPDYNFTDNSGKDDPQRRACLRCRSKVGWYYRKDRLLYPLKQTGERGDVNGFARITWEQAFSEISQKMGAVAALNEQDMINEGRRWMAGLGADAGKTTFTALCVTGDGSSIGSSLGSTILDVFGAGQPYPANVYSYPCLEHTTRYVADNYTWGYKVALEANSRTDYVNADQVVMWCTNPADSIMGTNSMWYLQQAKEAGVKFVCVDNRVSRTSALLNAKHIAPLPGTDSALVMGMLYHLLDTMLKDKAAGKPQAQWIIDPDFIKTYVYGFFDTDNTCIIKPNKEQYTDTLWYDLYQRALPINFHGGAIPGMGTVPAMGFGPATKFEVPKGASLSAYIFGTDRRLIDAGLNLATSIYPGEIGYNVREPGHLSANDTGDVLYNKRTRMYGQTPKTLAWASKITGVPVADIKQLAEDIARKKTTILMTGAMQKSCEGEQHIWSVYALAFVTGCFGLPGQSIGTISSRNKGALLAVSGPSQPPAYTSAAAAIKTKMARNFIRAEKMSEPTLMDTKTAQLFHIMLWQDQMEYGGTGKSRWNAPEVKFGPTIKGIYMAGGNSLINQGGDTNYCMNAVKNRNNAHVVVVSDFFMTPSAQFADYVLPAAMPFERVSMATEWQCGENIINMPKAIEPPGEAITDTEMWKGIATAAGKGDAIPYEKDKMGEYAESAFDKVKASYNYGGSYEDFKKAGIISISDKSSPDVITNAYFRESAKLAINPYGLCTSTGKFEAYSQSLMEDYEARRYNNFDAATGKLAVATDENNFPYQGRIASKACSFQRVEDTPSAAMIAASAAEQQENEECARFVYPIPMYIPLIEGTHACDSDTALGAYPAADADGATKHPDLLGAKSSHPYMLSTFHSIKRSHSSVGNNSPLVAETFKYDGSGNPAFLDPDRVANTGVGANLPIYDKDVYEPVYMHPDDAAALGVTKTGERVKLTSVRNTAIYAAAHITKTVRPGHLVMAEGGWVCLDENGVDIGGAVNTLFSLRPSRIARGTTMGNGLRLKVEKI